jgi:hypothetical protein
MDWPRRLTHGAPNHSRTFAVLDVIRIVALLVAGSACLRPRYVAGLLVVAVIALVDAPAMVLPLLHRDASPPSLFYGFIFLLWGPSGMPTPPAPWSLLDFLDRSPLARAALSSGLAFFAMAGAYRRSKPLRPETPEARLWDAIGLRFLFVGVLDSLLVVVGILLRTLDA